MKGRLHLIRTAFGFFVPFLIMTLYLVLTRRQGNNADWDWLALVISCLIGLMFILPSATQLSRRVLLSLLYLPIIGAFLFFYSFAFVCAVFQNCL